jgi:hypothetical protein
MQTVVPFAQPTRFRSCYFRIGNLGAAPNMTLWLSERNIHLWDLAPQRVTPKGKLFRTRGWFIVWYVQIETLEFRSPKE